MVVGRSGEATQNGKIVIRLAKRKGKSQNHCGSQGNTIEVENDARHLLSSTLVQNQEGLRLPLPVLFQLGCKFYAMHTKKLSPCTKIYQQYLFAVWSQGPALNYSTVTVILELI